MLFELIAVITAGIATAGILLLAGKALPRLPRWSAPLAAGLAMLGVAIALEYGWYGRTAAALPPRVEVALTRELRAPLRPWTYLAPYVDGFVAVDHGSVRTHPEAQARRLVDLYLFGRWVPPRRVRAVFDCAVGRRADLGPGVSLAPGGELEGARWVETGADDPVTRAACAPA